MAANLYDVNIEIIYVDGSINTKENKKFEVSKKVFFSEKNKKLPQITLLYNLNCYFKTYHLADFIAYKTIYKRYASNIKEIIFDDNEFTCNFCKKKENNKKIYFKNQLISACIQCISKKSDTIFNSRFFNFQKDCFLSRECKYFNSFKIKILKIFLYLIKLILIYSLL